MFAKVHPELKITVSVVRVPQDVKELLDDFKVSFL
jgi:hypothetical protein